MELMLLVVFIMTMLYTSITTRVETYVKMLIVQGAVLSTLILMRVSSFHLMTALFLVAETLLFKTIVIPFFMMKSVRENLVLRESSPRVPAFYSAIVTAVLFVFGFGLAYWVMGVEHTIRPLYFGIALSTIMAALFIIVTRRMLVTHVAAFIMMENGIFLLSLSVSHEMPLVVNLGVLLDIFVALFMFGLFIARIKSTFDELDVDQLTSLKG